MISENYYSVKENIVKACEKAGREVSEVKLMAVSKTKPAEMVQEIYDCGQRIFGENKVQELSGKVPVLPSDIEWHLIGHLQHNKVKQAVANAYAIHSVDSVRLAEYISREAVKQGKIQNILLEVNAAGEESKFGFMPDEVTTAAEEISKLDGIKVIGLMTVAPNVEDPNENRPVFRCLRELGVDINSKKFNNISISEYSMGMTNDYAVAIEEGATYIRVGTAIFGERNYNI